MTVVPHRNPGETFAGYTQLVTDVCCSCGVTFAMPEMLRDKALADHNRSFYCPNGHSQHFTGKTEAEKQRERAERALARADRLAADRTALEHRLNAQKSATTRARNQRDRERHMVSHGVCPCCKRTFKQLARHMKSQHPDYGPIGDHA